MDQSTHSISRVNWLNIITQYQERSDDITVKKKLYDNGIKEKAYYYWLHKFRKEIYEQLQFTAISTSTGTEVAFAEVTISNIVEPNAISQSIEFTGNLTAVIKCNELTIEISNEISDSLLSRILKEVVHT
ncbi:MAG: IS66 family insertion sequence element accessory protein TnpB [Lachnospirales bacterium]